MNEPTNSNGLLLKLFDASEDHGYKIMTERLRTGKHTLKRLAEVFSLRASMEEEYSKKLSKIARTLEDSEFGTLQSTIDTFRQQTDELSKKHNEFAIFLKNNIEQSIMDLLAKQKTIREQHLSLAEKNIKNSTLAHQQQLRAQAKYAIKCQELTALREAKDAKMGKDYDKVMLKFTKVDQSAKVLENELKQAETQALQARKIWETEWQHSLSILEDLELERTQHIGVWFVHYTTSAKELIDLEKQANDQIAFKASAVNTVSDLSDFIQFYTTSQPTSESSNSKDRSSTVASTRLPGSNSSHVMDSITISSTSSMASGTTTERSSHESNQITSLINTFNQAPSPSSSSSASTTYVMTLYDYQAQSSEELSFEAGEYLKILEMTESGWWMAERVSKPSLSSSTKKGKVENEGKGWKGAKGSTKGAQGSSLEVKKGLIPSNFVQVLTPEEQQQASLS